ncbi:hypothetical protein ACWCPQ_05945 [Nocardia sp. NPDC001965]
MESPVFREALDKAAAEPKTATPLGRLLRRPRPLVPACAAGIGSFALPALATSRIIAYTTGIGSSGRRLVELGGPRGAARIAADRGLP